MVTGEPIPAEKREGDEVVGGSVNQTGTLVFVATRVGEDSFLAQVARHIEQARALKPGIIQLVDRILKVYVPAVLAAAALAILIWTAGDWALTGRVDVARAIFAALAALVMGYPCALGMATPLAMMRGGGIAASRGILMRSGEPFQIFGQIDRALLDKTGTLTQGKPKVVELVPADGVTEEQLLALAAAAEDPSEHPLGRAVVSAAWERGLAIPQASEFQFSTGQGVAAKVAGAGVLVGKPGWLAAQGFPLDGLSERLAAMENRAQTVIAAAAGGRLLGLVGIADQLKPDAREAVQRLHKAGIEVVMITGDNERTAQAVATQAGISDFRAQALPGEKAQAVRELQAQGHRVMMVGDGINDAPALTQADIGIAIGAGTDIAIESSDVVLIGERLTAVAEAREIGAESFRKTKQNLTVAFIFNGIGVPAAITGLVAPTWAMIAMITSVSTVLANSFGARLRPRSLLTLEKRRRQRRALTQQLRTEMHIRSRPSPEHDAQTDERRDRTHPSSPGGRRTTRGAHLPRHELLRRRLDHRVVSRRVIVPSSITLASVSFHRVEGQVQMDRVTSRTCGTLAHGRQAAGRRKPADRCWCRPPAKPLHVKLLRGHPRPFDSRADLGERGLARCRGVVSERRESAVVG